MKTPPPTKRNGCHNRPEYAQAYYSTNGTTPIPHTGTRDCQYTLSQFGRVDPGCIGCTWRKPDVTLTLPPGWYEIQVDPGPASAPNGVTVAIERPRSDGKFYRLGIMHPSREIAMRQLIKKAIWVDEQKENEVPAA